MCFPTDGGANDADLDKEDDCWLDLGLKNSEEKEKIMRAKIPEAKNYGLSTAVCKHQETPLCEFGDVVKLTPDAGQPAKIGPLRIQL